MPPLSRPDGADGTASEGTECRGIAALGGAAVSSYYNEFDPFAAAWLRELIKDGQIADGEVDERSIVDVRPDDLRGFTQCHFFAGIGGWSYALRLAGWPDDAPVWTCLLYTSPSPRDGLLSRMPSSA